METQKRHLQFVYIVGTLLLLFGVLGSIGALLRLLKVTGLFPGDYREHGQGFVGPIIAILGFFLIRRREWARKGATIIIGLGLVLLAVMAVIALVQMKWLYLAAFIPFIGAFSVMIWFLNHANTLPLFQKRSSWKN